MQEIDLVSNQHNCLVLQGTSYTFLQNYKQMEISVYWYSFGWEPCIAQLARGSCWAPSSQCSILVWRAWEEYIWLHGTMYLVPLTYPPSPSLPLRDDIHETWWLFLGKITEFLGNLDQIIFVLANYKITIIWSHFWHHYIRYAPF